MLLYLAFLVDNIYILEKKRLTLEETILLKNKFFLRALCFTPAFTLPLCLYYIPTIQKGKGFYLCFLIHHYYSTCLLNARWPSSKFNERIKWNKRMEDIHHSWLWICFFFFSLFQKCLVKLIGEISPLLSVVKVMRFYILTTFIVYHDWLVWIRVLIRDTMYFVCTIFISVLFLFYSDLYVVCTLCWHYFFLNLGMFGEWGKLKVNNSRFMTEKLNK